MKNHAFPDSEKLSTELHRSPTDLPGLPMDGGESVMISQHLLSSMVQIAGQVWRLGSIAVSPETGDPRAELSAQEIRKLANTFEALQEAIQGLGIRVIDRCQEDFHPGLPDRVITEEPREGISKELIIRTIRPTIMWHQTMIQRGEIDIAVPAAGK